MKKALVLVSLASLAAVSFGCVVTDYPAMPTQNKSHGLIGCSSNDRIANAQQTIEAQTRDLLYTSSYGTGSNPSGICTAIGTFDPAYTLNNVSSQDARDWNRFNANWSFFGEAQVFGVPNGTWLLCGIKDLADGSTRINSLHTDATGAFSCVGDAVDGRYGGPEGVVYGDQFGRLPGLHIDAVAVDQNGTGQEWCSNIIAGSADAASTGFSTYWAFNGRAYEGSLAATPITRRAADLGALLQGTTQSVVVEGVTVTGRGALNADGTITFELQGLSNGQASYQAESPVKFTVNPANRFKTFKIENANETEMVKLARFAVDGGLSGRTIDLTGKQIAEFGYTFPPVSLTINTQALVDFTNNPADWQ